MGQCQGSDQEIELKALQISFLSLWSLDPRKGKHINKYVIMKY